MSAHRFNREMLQRLEAALDQGAYELAEDVLSAANEEERRLPEVLWLSARCRFDRGDWPGALVELAALEETPGAEAVAWQWRIRALAASGDRQETSRQLRQPPARASASEVRNTGLLAWMSLGCFAELEMLLREESSADPSAVERLAGNLIALHGRQSALGDRLARSRPWDLLGIGESEGEPAPYRRTGREPVALYDPALQNPKEARALAECEKSIDVRAPVLVHGIGTGQVLDELANAPAAVGKRLSAVVVVRDWRDLSAQLFLRDWIEPLTAGVFHFLGENASELADYLRADLRRVPLHGRFAVCDCIDDERSRDYLAGVEATLATLRNECANSLHAMEAYYAGGEFRERWRSAEESVGARRVAIQTCRYTTFIYASTIHLAEAFRSQGCEVELWGEGDEPQQWVGPWYVARRLAEFRPDLVVRINFLRQETETPFPRGMPFATWVQDYCPSHLDHGRATKMTSRDYVIGISKTNLVDVGYPAERCLLSPVPTPASIYFAPARGGREYLHDVSYVSHQSTPPAVWRERFARSGRAAEEIRFVDHVYERLRSEFDAGRILYSVHLQLGAEFINEVVPCPWPAWVSLHSMQLTNLFFRHAILEWAGATGRKLAIFGNGWEKHPTLSRYARGPVANGSALRELYRRSAVNLQLMATGNLHQRLVDGFLAGGFFLMPRLDAYQRQLREIDSSAHRQLVRTLAEEDVSTFAELRERHPALATYLREAGAQSTFQPFLVTGSGDDRAFCAAEQDVVSDALLRFPTTEKVLFSDRFELAAQLDYWLARPDERETFTARMQQSGALDAFTAEFQTRRLLRWLHRRTPLDLL